MPIRKSRDTIRPQLISLPERLHKEERQLLQIKLAEMQRSAQDKFMRTGKPYRVARWRVDYHIISRGPRKGQSVIERHKIRKAVKPNPLPSKVILTKRHGMAGLKGAIRFNLHRSLPVGWIFYSRTTSPSGGASPDVYGSILSGRRISWRPIERAIYNIYRSMGGSLKELISRKILKPIG